MHNLIPFPRAEQMGPQDAVVEIGKTEWQQIISLGVTRSGEFEIVNSEMSAERALWLLEWAKRWAMGLEIG